MGMCRKTFFRSSAPLIRLRSFFEEGFDPLLQSAPRIGIPQVSPPIDEPLRPRRPMGRFLIVSVGL